MGRALRNLIQYVFFPADIVGTCRTRIAASSDCCRKFFDGDNGIVLECNRFCL